MNTKLPACRELLTLCDRYPRAVSSLRSDIDIPPISLSSVPNLRSVHTTGASQSRKRKDTIDREEVRKAKLESDPWSDKTRLTPKSVFCLGCKRDIRLDRRNDYYPGLWLKHRGLCQGIARMKAKTPRGMSPAVVDSDDAASFKDSSEEPEERIPLRRKSKSHVSIDDEQAALILIELMSRGRTFSSSDSDSSSSYYP
ncbi:hypothetical protein AAF712_012830 [Marasmius tenuissimus]|uniref:Uncharacterized protein n=1 Tax=Marasmius tenuissimus TaxID=585030 RepID=A0ABR2ZGR3_9AGAR